MLHLRRCVAPAAKPHSVAWAADNRTLFYVTEDAAMRPHRLWRHAPGGSQDTLLDRGVIVAIAHVRGGGEGGKPWHDAGRMLQKRNTFTDFIACAECLIEVG
jgi:protease II